MFLVDKYRPTKIDDMVYHKDIVNKLINISKNENVPHIIFYGPENSGKKTLVHIFLELLYDESVHKMTETKYNVTGSSRTITEISIKQSNFHIVIERNNNNNSDKYIVQDIIKEYAMRVPMNFFKTKRSFKTVLIKNVDKLSYFAQTSLRRTMELYAHTCRFIMISSSLSKVIEPLRSRCYCIRVPLPNRSEIFSTLMHVSLNENIKLSLEQTDNIIKSSNRNIKECLWKLDMIKFDINEDSELIKTINTLGNLILENKIKNIISIRVILYKLMVTTINGSTIIKIIIDNLLSKINNDYIKYLLINSSCKYENRLVMGRRDIKQLEGFIIDCFYILQNSNDIEKSDI